MNAPTPRAAGVRPRDDPPPGVTPYRRTVAGPNVFDRTIRWWDAHPLGIDVAATLATLLVVVPTSSAVLGTGGTVALNGSTGPGGGPSLSFWAVAAFTLLVIGPLTVRRRLPTLSVVLCYSGALVHLASGVVLLLPADLFVLLALYSVTVHGPRWAHRVAAGGALLGSWIVASALTEMLDGRPSETVIGGIVITLMFAVAWAFGMVRRSRRERMAALTDRADQLERERDQQSQLATAAERNRIAREMHDIVAHSLSVIIAQADGGRYAAAQHPEAALRSLTTISEAGRAALSDMRRLLGVLRDHGDSDLEASHASAQGPPAASPAGHAPQPGLADLGPLISQVRDSGVAVSLVTMGTPRTLPPGTGLAVFRICQEALTNVLKHAGPHPNVAVMLVWRSESLVLEITDDGRGASTLSDGAGHGVVGMRERATMFHGTLTAGPRPGGGFRVRLELPLPPRPSENADA